MIVTRDFQHLISDIVLSRPIRLHDRLDQILRHILIISQKLLCIFGKTVAAIAEGRIVIKFPDPWIQTDTIDDFCRTETFRLRIGIQLIEIRYTHCQIRICEKLHRFRFRKSHEPCRDVLLDRSFLEKSREGMRCLHQLLICRISTDNDTARIKVIIERLAFTQKFRAKDDILRTKLLTDVLRVADGNRRLDDHDGIRIVLHHQLNDRFDRAGVKEILSRIIIGRRRNNDEVRVLVRRLRIHRRRQIQSLLCQVLLDIDILDRRLSMIHHIHLFWDDIHCHHMIVLRKKRRQRQTHIPCTSYRNIH